MAQASYAQDVLAVNYVGGRQASLNPDELALRLGDYVRADAFVQWEYSRHLEFQMRFENLADEFFIQGNQSDALRLTPGAPFAVRGEIQITFLFLRSFCAADAYNCVEPSRFPPSDG